MREKEEKWERKNFEFRQWCYQNSCSPNSLPECVLCARSVSAPKKKSIAVMPLLKQGKKIGNCGNVIAENGREKKIWNGIVAMALSKQVKFFFGNCDDVIAENGRKKEKLWLLKSREEFFKKKKKVLRLQYFHNKSHVISYYQFKFEFNTEITFLIQQ